MCTCINNNILKKHFQFVTSPILIEEKDNVRPITINFHNTKTCLYVTITKFIHLRWPLGSFTEVNHNVDMWSPALSWQCIDNHYDYAWAFFCQPWISLFRHQEDLVTNNLYLSTITCMSHKCRMANSRAISPGPTLWAMTHHIKPMMSMQIVAGSCAGASPS